MEKYGQYRDKGTCTLPTSPSQGILTEIAGSGIAPFFPVSPPPSNPLLLPSNLVCAL